MKIEVTNQSIEFLKQKLRSLKSDCKMFNEEMRRSENNIIEYKKRIEKRIEFTTIQIKELEKSLKPFLMVDEL